MKRRLDRRALYVLSTLFRKAAKKVLLSMAVHLRPNPPPRRAKWPLKFWNVEEKCSEKVLFSLMALSFTPPPS